MLIVILNIMQMFASFCITLNLYSFIDMYHTLLMILIDIYVSVCSTHECVCLHPIYFEVIIKRVKCVTIEIIESKNYITDFGPKLSLMQIYFVVGIL